jgi:hypothetical protein
VTIVGAKPNQPVYINGLRAPFNTTSEGSALVQFYNTDSANYIQVGNEKNGTTIPLNTEFQPVGWLNLFFWPGFIIDFGTGKMMRINPSFVDLSGYQ